MHTKNDEALGAVMLVMFYIWWPFVIHVAFFYCLFQENLLYMCPFVCKIKNILRIERKYTDTTIFVC